MPGRITLKHLLIGGAVLAAGAFASLKGCNYMRSEPAEEADKPAEEPAAKPVITNYSGNGVERSLEGYATGGFGSYDPVEVQIPGMKHRTPAFVLNVDGVDHLVTFGENNMPVDIGGFDVQVGVRRDKKDNPVVDLKEPMLYQKPLFPEPEAKPAEPGYKLIMPNELGTGRK